MKVLAVTCALACATAFGAAVQVPDGVNAVDVEVPLCNLSEGGTNRAFFTLGVLGTQTNIEYLKSLIDCSTEEERGRSLFSPTNMPTIPVKMDFEPRNYWFFGGN